MSSLNRVTLIGRLGKDPEVKSTTKGTPVATFSIATSESWKDKQTGEKVEKTEWHRVVVYDALADICGRYLRKGSQAYIEGKIQTRKWTDQSGAEKQMTEIVCKELVMLGGGEQKAARPEPTEDEWGHPLPTRAKTTVQKKPAPPPISNEDFGDDVPF